MNKTYVASEGRECMVIGPCCWGRDKTASKALRIAKANKPRSIERAKYVLYDAPVGTWMDDFGRFHWPDAKASAPKEIV